MTSAGPAPLRVVHVRNSDRLSGPERLLLDQARQRDVGVDASLAVFVRPGTSSPLLEAAEAAGLATHRIEQRSSYDHRITARLVAVLEEARADVVVTHDYKANVVGAKAARKLGLPWVAVVHGYTGEDAKVRAFEAWDRRALRKADAVVVVSDALAERLAARGVPRERIHRVDNGIDAVQVADAADRGRAAARAALGASGHQRLIVALGRTSPEKGQDVLLEAFARVAPEAPDLRLALVGDGADRERLTARAAALGLADRVALPGWRSDGPACLAAAEVAVLPSRTEGLPIALLEALAVGVPVVVTDVGAMAEVVEHGRAGLVVPPDDAAALARALTRVLADPAGAKERAAYGRQRVTEHYGTRAQAKRLAAIYRSCFA
ncbi:MAG: glycosyltransferase [Planctomycetota bacterium]